MYIYTHPDALSSEIFPECIHKEAQLHIFRNELSKLQNELSNTATGCLKFINVGKSEPTKY
jgi:hypothetical protein